MIKILQTGQFGSTKYLVDMHRVRTKIFKERMGWDVQVNHMELEIDEYDLPQTVYILYLNEQEKVVGTWRFLLNTEPSMIKNIWPQYLDSLPIPVSRNMCETSRFGVNIETNTAVPSNQKTCETSRFGAQSSTSGKNSNRKMVNKATYEMIAALIDVCIKCGITEMYTLYDVKVKRLLEKIGFTPFEVSDEIDLEGNATVTARFKMNRQLLEDVCSKTGVVPSITPNDLPPLLLEKFLNNQSAGQEDAVYAGQ